MSCKDAHGACVSYQAAWQFVNNSIICAAVIPLLGAASDRKGRKPILIISTLLAGSPPFLLLFSGKFKVLYPVISLATGLGPLGTCLAITSDLIQKKNRSQAMSIVSIRTLSYLHYHYHLLSYLLFSLRLGSRKYILVDHDWAAVCAFFDCERHHLGGMHPFCFFLASSMQYRTRIFADP